MNELQPVTTEVISLDHTDLPCLPISHQKAVRIKSVLPNTTSLWSKNIVSVTWNLQSNKMGEGGRIGTLDPPRSIDVQKV
jgi:hypothetical protein